MFELRLVQKGVCVDYFVLLYFRKLLISSEQCGPGSDGVLSTAWSGVTLVAQGGHNQRVEQFEHSEQKPNKVGVYKRVRLRSEMIWAYAGRKDA